MLFSGEFFKMRDSKKLLTILSNVHSEFFNYRKARVSSKSRLSVLKIITQSEFRDQDYGIQETLSRISTHGLNRDRPNLHINHTIQHRVT